MSQSPPAAQEPRDQNVAVRCTASEKEDVRLVAAFDRTTESDLLRTALHDVRARAAAIRAGRAISSAAA